MQFPRITINRLITSNQPWRCLTTPDLSVIGKVGTSTYLGAAQNASYFLPLRGGSSDERSGKELARHSSRRKQSQLRLHTMWWRRLCHPCSGAYRKQSTYLPISLHSGASPAQ